MVQVGVLGALARLVEAVEAAAMVEDGGDEWGAAVDEAHEALADAGKRCAKCDGPIPSPVLGDDPCERCPLCGDEPPSGAEVAELLEVAMRPLIALRDRVLDVESMIGDDNPFYEAARDVDGAFDRLDSAIKWLEQLDDGPHDDA